QGVAGARCQLAPGGAKSGKGRRDRSPRHGSRKRRGQAFGLGFERSCIAGARGRVSRRRDRGEQPLIFLAQTFVDAISVGSGYALSGLGIGLLFGIMRLINFAQSEFVTVGAYTLLVCSGLWFPIGGLLAAAAVVILAVLVDRLAFRPVRDADP